MIISDLDKGLSTAVKKNFLIGHHNKCSFHIFANLVHSCGSNKTIRSLFYKCASSTTEKQYK